MKMSLVVKLGRKYLTEDIIAAFEGWGDKKLHSTTEAAGDIVAWYRYSISECIEMGNKGSHHHSFANSLHLGHKFSRIFLSVELDDKAQPGGATIVKQYQEFKKKEKETRKLLAEIGLFVKTKLASEKASPA